MTVGIRVLRTKYRTDLEYTLHVGRNGHLLGELKRLHKESGVAEIVDFEDCRARFGTGLLELCRVGFGGALGGECLSEERA